MSAGTKEKLGVGGSAGPSLSLSVSLDFCLSKSLDTRLSPVILSYVLDVGLVIVPAGRPELAYGCLLASLALPPGGAVLDLPGLSDLSLFLAELPTTELTGLLTPLRSMPWRHDRMRSEWPALNPPSCGDATAELAPPSWLRLPLRLCAALPTLVRVVRMLALRPRPPMLKPPPMLWLCLRPKVELAVSQLSCLRLAAAQSWRKTLMMPLSSVVTMMLPS